MGKRRGTALLRLFIRVLARVNNRTNAVGTHMELDQAAVGF